MTPEVRQDRREGSRTFGAVAVKLPDGSPFGEWAVMTTTSGGSFTTAATVAGWTVMTEGT